MSEFEAGDRVKIGHLEGEVTEVNLDGSLDVEFDNADYRNAYYLPADLAEKIAARPKVGDTIAGIRAYQALPYGAVVVDGSDVNVRTADGFIDNDGQTFPADRLHSPRTLVYLPA